MTFYNKYVIVYTSLFQNELEKILRYIAFNLDSPNIARSFYKKITNKLYSLQHFPERYTKINYKNKSLRKLLVHRYVIINEINSIIDDTLPHLDVKDVERSHIHIIDGYVGRGYSLSRKEELEAISDLSRHSGIILDPVYTGKAYYGLIHELEKGTFDHAKNILFMHTGGIYGLFSKSKEIISA